jgi:Na+-transporting NADH:ubiquinone oxidoreductase subunit NqrC
MSDKRFVLRSDDGDYYRGNTYIHQGEFFPGLGKKTEAKKYKTRKLAERVQTTLKQKVETGFEVVEIEDSGITDGSVSDE